MELKEEDAVLCTVTRIEGAIVFLDIEGNGKGSMVISEVAAGRIRNLRAYVAPNKKIVCKVLKILPENIQLSLRRVTAKEREEVLKRYKKEKTFTAVLSTVVKDPKKIIEKIKEEQPLWRFIEDARENPQLLEKYINKEEAQKLTALTTEKEDREKRVKKIIILKSFSENGVVNIKEVCAIPGIDIRYLGSSQFSVSAVAKDFKEAQHKVSSIIVEIEKRAKEKKAIFEIKEK